MSGKKEAQIIDNLKDVGFNETEIKEFIDLYESRDLKEQYRYLDKKRKRLLDKVHENEKNISCIDYLKYVIKNRKEGKDEE